MPGAAANSSNALVQKNSSNAGVRLLTSERTSGSSDGKGSSGASRRSRVRALLGPRFSRGFFIFFRYRWLSSDRALHMNRQ